jgi:hypothetical protein
MRASPSTERGLSDEPHGPPAKRAYASAGHTDPLRAPVRVVCLQDTIDPRGLKMRWVSVNWCPGRRRLEWLRRKNATGHGML